MDEDEYKNTYAAVNRLTCPFEKAVLARQCDCQYLLRFNIAEREAAGCSVTAAQQGCVALLGLLRQKAQFALQLTAAPIDVLPHGKEIKVQVGGLRGIRQAVSTESPEDPVANIHALREAALERFGGLEKLPFGEIVKVIAAYEGRPRRGRRGNR